MPSYQAARRGVGRTVAAVLSFVLAGAASLAALFGLFVVYTANSPSNRATNPFAGIAVGFGWVLMIVMTLLALLLVAIGFLFRRPRADPRAG